MKPFQPVAVQKKPRLDKKHYVKKFKNWKSRCWTGILVVVQARHVTATFVVNRLLHFIIAKDTLSVAPGEWHNLDLSRISRNSFFFKNRFSTEFEKIASYWSQDIRNAKIKEITSNKITDISATRPLLAIEQIAPTDESCLALEPNYETQKLKFCETAEVKEIPRKNTGKRAFAGSNDTNWKKSIYHKNAPNIFFVSLGF